MSFRLGEILIKKGYITKEQLDGVLSKSPPSEEMMGKLLMKSGALREEQLMEAVAEQLGLSFVPNLRSKEIPMNVVKAVSEKLVQRYNFMPIELKDNVLTIAVSNPMDIWIAEDIKMHLGFGVQRVLSLKNEIDDAIRKYYGLGSGSVDQIIAGAKQEKTSNQPQSEQVEDIEKSAEEASVIKIVNQVLSEAISMRTSDIHLEIYNKKVHLRYRIDGVLREMKLPEDIYYIQPAIVSRIKIMAHLDVVEHRLPQDGRVKVRLQDGIEVDLRVSIIPGYFGENVVIRILPSQILVDLNKLGFAEDEFKKINKIIQKPHGIILITGPTGSGKTTTLYACLSYLNKPNNKIISIEDPVEYALEGITQIQVNSKIGLTFPSALRSVLRHDPDVMMVGEIRDSETADLAIRSSLTGHLVFSTLHTNDAPSAIARLVDMGIESYLLASSLEVIIAQRLVRLLCQNCKGAGCSSCNGTGYHGRQSIFEILMIEDKLREMIISRAPASDIKKKARELGMRTLRENGMVLVTQGLTDEKEITRVVESE